MNFRKKCGEMRQKKIIFTVYFLYLFAVNAVNRGELFTSKYSNYSYKKEASSHGFEPLTSYMHSTA